MDRILYVTILFGIYHIIQEVHGVFYEDSFRPLYDDLFKNSRSTVVPRASPRVFETISEIGNPSNVYMHHDIIFISLFRDNQVLMGSMINRTVSGFADGSYCTKDRDGAAKCGIVDGPWGMRAFNDSLYVSSFGSDQILVFSLKGNNFGWFIDSFGDSDHLDCPEGIHIDPVEKVIYIANYNANNVVVFSLKTRQYLKTFISASSGLGYLMGPESIVYDPLSGYFAVTSYGNDSVLFFTKNGKLSRVLGGFSEGTALISTTQLLAEMAASGELLDLDLGNTGFPLSHRYSHREPGWKAVRSQKGFQLSGPTGLALTPQNTFVVTLYKVSYSIQFRV